MEVVASNIGNIIKSVLGSILCDIDYNNHMQFLVNAYSPIPFDIVTSNLTQMHRSRAVESTDNILCDLDPKVKVI